MSGPSPSRSAASSRTVATGAGSGIARCSQPHAARNDTRVGRLWQAIRRTRAELESRVRRSDEIGERFTTTIRPREERFTRTVCRVTERLVHHHEVTLLAGDERTLLGLWVNENLQSLANHPFAPRTETDRLAWRWHRHLGRAEHPLDVPLASLYARQAGGARPDVSPPQGQGAWHERRREGEARPVDEPAADEDLAGAHPLPDSSIVAAAPDDTQGELHRLLARLFRRLARVLHPDREPDEASKRDKHRLMSECLRARDERDIDTLLSLYAAHVGEPSAALADDDVANLERLLNAQLEALQRRLRRCRSGDALRCMIVERYAGDDRIESERRFAEHARALDGETLRFEGLERLVRDADGLRQALAERRELELDRLSIDELTGVSRG